MRDEKREQGNIIAFGQTNNIKRNWKFAPRENVVLRNACTPRNFIDVHRGVFEKITDAIKMIHYLLCCFRIAP